MKCLQQLAHEFPHASKVLLENMYMDDILTGTNTLEDAITLRYNLINVLDKGGFALAKWSSNDDSILSGLPTTNNSITPLDSNASTKTLGLSWNCKRDILKYDIKINPKTNQITKRTILSTIASIYDPLSLLSPIFVEAKLILQKLWQLKCDWDDILPSDIEQSFKVFLSNLPFINDIEIPKKVIRVYPFKDIQLHGFADASTKAYGAVIFRVTDFSDKHYINILCSKVRIAPIKTITIPRLVYVVYVVYGTMCSVVIGRTSE
jgi:hypothetical protein